MYQFIDSVSGGGQNVLPAEGVSINGTYIENLISGYRTLYVKGRESLAKEITEYDSTGADGSRIKRTRFPSRTLTVGFQLVADSNANFRAAFNILNSILNVEDATIVFADETDKYFVGCPVLDAEIPEGRNSVTGEYQIYCPDPFKYSVSESDPVTVSTAYDISGLEEYSEDQAYGVGDMVKHKDGNDWKAYECNAANTTGTWNASKWNIVTGAAFVVDYDGGYKIFPRFEVDFATDESGGTIGHDADCGFVQFAKVKGDNTYRLQFGDDSEEQYIPTEDFNSDFKANTLGEFSNAPNGTYHEWTDDAEATPSTSGIKPAYGSGTGFHGAYITANAIAEEDFIFTWKQCLYVSAAAQKFGFMAVCLDDDDNIVAGVRYYKDATGNTKGYVQTVLDGNYGEPVQVDFKRTGFFGYTKSSGGSIRDSENYIKRDGEVITIKLANDTSAINLYPTEITSVAKVGFFLCGIGTAKRPAANIVRAASFMGSLDKNTFGSGDILDVDCSSAEVQLNKMDVPSLGDVGNDWSNFGLDVGTNTIFVAYSDWCQMPPTFRMYYRKRWL